MSLKKKDMTGSKPLKAPQFKMSVTTTNPELKDKLISSAGSSLYPSSALINEKRKAALDVFASTGFPGKKDEEYKYSNIRPYLKHDFTLDAGNVSIEKKDLDSFCPIQSCIRLVVVNGQYNDALSTITELKGFTVLSFKEAIGSKNNVFEKHVTSYAEYELDPFVALNTALWTDGIFIHVDKNCVLDKPVHVIHVSTSEAARVNQTRLLVVMEDGSSATIIEQYETIRLSGISFTNQVAEVILKNNAVLHHYILENECENGVLVNNTHSCLNTGSNYHVNTITVNGGFVRNNLNIVLNQTRCEANLFGLYAGDGKMHIDNHTLVDHRMPDCQSNELYKGILDDNSVGVFNGKIFVKQDAQRTNAFQSNKNILLSDDASMNTKPQLEIYANDVKCSHGSSTGQLDNDALFYLRARGLSVDSAKRLMVEAFAGEVIQYIRQEELRNFVAELVTKKLS